MNQTRPSLSMPRPRDEQRAQIRPGLAIRTQSETAAALGVSRQVVHKLEQSALNKLAADPVLCRMAVELDR